MVDPTMAQDKKCHVGKGTYNYGNVNIRAGGSLVFDELLPDVRIDFWAKSILVENMGSLSAGDQAVRRTAECSPSIFTALTKALVGRG